MRSCTYQQDPTPPGGLLPGPIFPVPPNLVKKELTAPCFLLFASVNAAAAVTCVGMVIVVAIVAERLLLSVFASWEQLHHPLCFFVLSSTKIPISLTAWMDRLLRLYDDGTTLLAIQFLVRVS